MPSLLQLPDKILEEMNMRRMPYINDYLHYQDLYSGIYELNYTTGLVSVVYVRKLDSCKNPLEPYSPS